MPVIGQRQVSILSGSLRSTERSIGSSVPQVRTPSYFGDLQFDDEFWHDPHRGRTVLHICRKRALLDLETPGRHDGWPGLNGFAAKVLSAETVIPRNGRWH